MNKRDERILVCAALLMLCSVVSLFMGPRAGVWSFLQVATVVEIFRRLGENFDRRDTSGHCQSAQ